jgi:cephalosporin hydroxylase
MIQIDFDRQIVMVGEGAEAKTHSLQSEAAFAAISKAWLRCGWDAKYVYGFSWMGRPIIQLPEDIVRIQESIYAIKPDVIIETGVAHGGSLILYASLCKAMAKGRVIGIDIEIRPHNRSAIETHELASYITLIEGSSVAADVVARVRGMIRPGEITLVILDSNHTKDHVRQELEAYAPLVSVGSYVVACDGIMADLVGAPRSAPDWSWNNPQTAVAEFLREHPEFALEPPRAPFNEGMIADRVTYWPNAWVKRVR